MRRPASHDQVGVFGRKRTACICIEGGIAVAVEQQRINCTRRSVADRGVVVDRKRAGAFGVDDMTAAAVVGDRAVVVHGVIARTMEAEAVEVKVCPNCGETVSSKFCPKCGTEV